MKILLVSWSTLPNPGGSSVIVEQLARNFRPDELIVLGSRTWMGKQPPEREADMPEFRYFFTEMYFFGRGYRYFRWFRKWRFQPLVNEIRSIIRQEEIDHVIGVYPNDFYCLAACRAAGAGGVPFSSYFHNTYADNVAITDPNAQSIQQEIFDRSERVFVMSKGMQEFYREQYPGLQVEPLVHTFNTFPPADSLTGIPGTEKDIYRLVAIGNFNESNMEATVRFARAIADDPRFSLHLFTHVPKLLLQKRGLDPALYSHEGFVSPDAVHGALQAFDIGVLTHGFTGGYGAVEYRTIFPTRTIPMLLSGKPMIVHSPPGSFLNDFIEAHQCAELVDVPEGKALIRGLEKIISDEKYQTQLVGAARETARQFYGPGVVARLKSSLSKIKRRSSQAKRHDR
jgi:glycosyltransferase involved in cell wall biosynthesis